MKLIALPNSPFWGANIHVGYYPGGKKRYSLRSSKIRRDENDLDEHGRRRDKERAKNVLAEMQRAVNAGLASDTRTLSMREYDQYLRDLLRAAGISVEGNSPAWSTFSEETIERHCRDLSHATERSYRSKLSGFNKWLDGHERLSRESPLSEFRPSDLQAFYDWWISEGGASTTANLALKVVQLIFDSALAAEYLERNPCKGVKKRDNVSVSKEPFTLEDLGKICRVLAEHPEEIDLADEWTLAAQFSIFTGARQSDCVKRKWSDFADDFRRVSFVPQKKERLHRLGKKDMTVTLLLPDPLAAVLRAAHAVSRSEWVTPTLREIPAGKAGLGVRFRKILDLAGVKYTVKGGEGSKAAAQRSHTFHSFRHTLKTALREGGVSDASNHFVTGHDDAKVGARYIHEKSEAVFRECSPVFDQISAALA